jgi:hypothetical protein
LPTPTDTLARLLMPPVPEHTRENVVFAEMGPVFCEPLLDLAPLQPPDAVQAAAFVELQVSSEEPPSETNVGLAVITTDGATLTIALAVALVPFAPTHVSK